MPSYAPLPTIDQQTASTVFEPEGDGEGNWVGAPAVHEHDGRTLLAIRRRTQGQRGHAIEIYEVDGEDYERRRRITAGELGVVSVERPAMVTTPDSGALRLYLPVDHGGNDWTIQTFAPADSIQDIALETGHDVLGPKAGASDAVTVKDPYVVTVGGRFYMFYAGHDGHSEQAHVATSLDGENWERAAENPLLGRQYWHDFHTRISTVVPAPDAPVRYVFYEGSASSDDGNVWNLRTGVAISHDLQSVIDTTARRPRFAAPHGDRATGIDTFATFRYLDVVPGDPPWDVFYEVAREDGTFVLRRSTMSV